MTDVILVLSKSNTCIDSKTFVWTFNQDRRVTMRMHVDSGNNLQIHQSLDLFELLFVSTNASINKQRQIRMRSGILRTYENWFCLLSLVSRYRVMTYENDIDHNVLNRNFDLPNVEFRWRRGIGDGVFISAICKYLRSTTSSNVSLLEFSWSSQFDLSLSSV